MYYKQDFKQYLENQGNYNYAIIDPPWNYDSKPNAVMYNQLTYELWDNNDLKLMYLCSALTGPLTVSLYETCVLPTLASTLNSLFILSTIISR